VGGGGKITAETYYDLVCDPLKTFFASSAARLEKRFSFTYMEMAISPNPPECEWKECSAYKKKRPFSFRRPAGGTRDFGDSPRELSFPSRMVFC